MFSPKSVDYTLNQYVATITGSASIVSKFIRTEKNWACHSLVKRNESAYVNGIMPNGQLIRIKTAQ